VLLIDEVMTPDSSRYWPKDQYAPGGPQPSFDKQFVRDYLEAIAWNKQPPVPSLPDDVVRRTREKYVDAYQRLTGRPLESRMREQLEQLVEEMVAKGIRYEDALREFDKRFIAQVLAKAGGNLCKAADVLGVHRNTLSRKMAEYRLKRPA
jgi:DNA-binding NtrC family response regulator